MALEDPALWKARINRILGEDFVRGLILLMGVLGGLGMTLAFPFVGVLLWSWFSLQQPHQDAYGFAHTAPLNLVIAIVTLAAWILSSERKTPRMGFIFWMLVIFLAWMTFNSFFAFDPAWSWPYWDRTWKTFLLGLVIAATATTRIRLYALVWILVISLFYYGIKGGLFTIITGGNFHVLGPPSTIIGDNNQLAVALLMVLPLANYLRGQVADKRIASLLMAGTVLTIIAIVGTYSRGALIGLATLAVVMLLRARKRLVYLATLGVAILLIANFMPEHFFHRMDTISTATEDSSFEGRMYSWRVAFLYASDHFPFGAGFYGLQLGTIYRHYFPDRDPLAAHSIYFQVLGEHGFIGLGIYLTILAAALLRCARIISITRGQPEQQWAHDLAIAIQASLLVFSVAGAALSMAYYDLLVIEVGILLPLREIILPARKMQRPAWSPHAPTPQ
jgi:probable O-glycosylation ligase (exosortase A-associated)